MGEGVVWGEAPSSLGVWNVFRQIISSGVFLKSVNNVLNKYNLEKMALSLTDDFDVVKNVLDECGQISVTRFMKVSFGSISLPKLITPSSVRAWNVFASHSWWSQYWLDFEFFKYLTVWRKLPRHLWVTISQKKCLGRCIALFHSVQFPLQNSVQLTKPFVVC